MKIKIANSINEMKSVITEKSWTSFSIKKLFNPMFNVFPKLYYGIANQFDEFNINLETIENKNVVFTNTPTTLVGKKKYFEKDGSYMVIFTALTDKMQKIKAIIYAGKLFYVNQEEYNKSDLFGAKNKEGVEQKDEIFGNRLKFTDMKNVKKFKIIDIAKQSDRAYIVDMTGNGTFDEIKLNSIKTIIKSY